MPLYLNTHGIVPSLGDECSAVYTLRTEKPQSNEGNYPPRTSSTRENPLTNSRYKFLQPLGTSGNPSYPTALHFLTDKCGRPTPWFLELVDYYKTEVAHQTWNCRRCGLTTQNSHVKKGIHCPPPSAPRAFPFTTKIMYALNCSEYTQCVTIFYVVRTAHFGMKMYNDQRNAQVFNLFIYLRLPYMFRAFF
jgi:ribosomal protein L37E